MQRGTSNQSESEDDESNVSDAEDRVEDDSESHKKKKRANLSRVFEEIDRWDRGDHSEEEILVFIRKHLDDLNRSAGIVSIPGSHKDRKSMYGDFQFRRKWATNNDKILNTIVSCPLRDRCKCQCQAKITDTPEQTILYVADAHTAADHVPEKDDSKFLKFHTKALIATAVKVAPLQSATELIRNVQDSPTKHIDPQLKKSVQRLVRKQRASINSVLLEGVTIDNTIGSLARLSQVLWFGDAVQKHKAGECLDVFKIYVIGRQIMEGDRTVFLTFSNAWNLLNFWRAVATGYDVQLHGDVTSKASQAALNKLGFGVNMLGAHFAPLAFAIMPAECESCEAYVQAWRATKASVRSMLRLPTCDRQDCKTCRYMQELCDDPRVRAATSAKSYIEQKKMPIAIPLGDNSASWQKFAAEELGLPANVCQTHASAIAANNGTHKTHFDDMENYEAFYEYVCRIMRCSNANMGLHLQSMLVAWLQSVNEQRAANWFEEWWCGPTKGRWCLGHGGIGLTGNNQGLESSWRWDREAISHGRQVRWQNKEGGVAK
jgi:hypothetical protein